MGRNGTAVIDVAKNPRTPNPVVDNAFSDPTGVPSPVMPATNRGGLLEPDDGMPLRVQGIRRSGGAVQAAISCGRSALTALPNPVASILLCLERLSGTADSTCRGAD